MTASAATCTWTAVSNTALVSSCSSCATTVCNADSYCCTTLWDSTCVSEAQSLCGSTCGGSCTPTTCAAQGKNCGSIPDGCGGTLNCGSCGAGQVCTNNVCVAQSSCAHPDYQTGGALVNTCSSCTSKVCAADSFCCTSSWDLQCVNEASKNFGGVACCGHSLCETGAALTNGCNDSASQVCASDPSCCTSSWTSACVAKAQSVCGLTCP